MLKSFLHFESYEEAVEGLKDFGLEFAVTSELNDEECRRLVINVTDGIKAMRNHQQSEKGTKLL